MGGILAGAGTGAGDTAPGARRAVLLAVCLAGSLAVQAAAWRTAAAVIGREAAGGPARASGTSSALWIDAVGAQPSRPAPRPTGTARAAAADPVPAAPATPRSATTPTPAPPPAPGPAATESDNGLDRPRFYSFREVDVPAEPVTEWNLDPAALDALAASRIVFTLLVGSDGTVLYCSVDEPERLTTAARRALEARLKQTEMRPARRGGVAVASRRRVELFTVGGV